MAASDIHKHFKSLRAETGRRKGSRDPFATGFEDDSGDDKRQRRSSSQSKQAQAVEKPVASSKSTVASPFTAIDGFQDSDDEVVAPRKRIERYPSPAPAKIPLSRVADSAVRRDSLDNGVQGKGLQGGSQVKRTSRSRSAVVQAAGALAYLDDSDEDEDTTLRPTRSDRNPSPAPRKKSDPAVDAIRRSSTPKGSRDAPKDLGQSTAPTLIHTVASPFAGTKYLQDSDTDEDNEDDEEQAVLSPSTSLDSVGPTSTVSDPKTLGAEAKKVEKAKPTSSGVSWRAFSADREQQRSSELEALQISLKTRGKSISFGTHALTDDGNRVPLSPESAQASAVPRRKSRDKSPPRRAEDLRDTEDDGAYGAGVESHGPEQFKTSPVAGEAAAIRIETRFGTEKVTSIDQPLPQVASQTSLYTSPPSSDRAPESPTSHSDTSVLENSISSLKNQAVVSPPQTIPEGVPLNYPQSPIVSPVDITSPVSRNSSTRSLHASTRPTRIPNVRRSSRRSASANATSMSPAHAFLSSWSRDRDATEPAPDPKPDDEGQAIGLEHEYIIGKQINKGGFGVIKEVRTINKAGKRVVRAVKIVRKSLTDVGEVDNEKAQLELEHEVSIWRHLKHPHILELHAVYDTDFATFCVMDLNVGGTLFDIVRRSRASASESRGRKGLVQTLAKTYAYQLACALRYLHEDVRVCHRDVKLENCLIDMSGPDAESQGGNLRLCDFGLADFLHSDHRIDDSVLEQFTNRPPSSSTSSPTDQHPTTSSIIGTLEYASPRGLSVNRKLYETAGDVWAFGVIVYALCTGDLPFRHAMPSRTVEMILQAEWGEKALLNSAAGGEQGIMEVRELVKGCLERDIDKRLAIGEVLRSGWFEGCDRGGEGEEGMGGWR